jgi:hypothetical protein
MHTFTSVLSVVSDVPNPAPADPTGGSNGISLLLSYVKFGGLIACGIAALASGGLMAVGKLSNRPGTAEMGKSAFIWSMAGVIATAMAIPLINTVFGAAS